MENKLTAMQELLEWTRSTLPMDLDTPRMIEAKIESLLEKEKEQIIRAYMSGEIVEIFELNTTLTGSEYYANNYDTTKELPEEDSKRRAWHY
jgi:hypothetical protein